MRAFAPTLLILLAGFTSSSQASACRASLAEYRALQKGDTLAAVVKRLGCRGRKVTDLAYGRQRRVNYSWRGEGNFGANITLTFVNGRLDDKSELGLD